MAEKALVKPEKEYDLLLTIKTNNEAIDYSPDLLTARVVTSVSSPYPIVVLDLFIDPVEILTGKITAKSEIQLRVDLLGEEVREFMKETTVFDLMFLRSNLTAAPAEIGPGKRQLKDRSLVSMVCLCRKPFKTATGLVNWVYTNTTVQQIIQDLVSRLPNQADGLEIDTTDINQERIDQFVIPPMPFYKALQYLDTTFGIYNGIVEFHISYDNVVFITNLSKILNKDQVITIYQLPLDDPESVKKAEELCGDGKNFYTYAPIKSENVTNSRFSSMASDLKYIVKPKDKLFHTIEKDLSIVASNSGVIYKNKDIDVNQVTERTKYIIDHTGFETSDTFATAKVSKSIFNLSTATVFIERNLHLANLLKIGAPVKISTRNIQYIDLSGKYLLRSSDLRFTKTSSWNGVARLDLARTSTKVGLSQ